MRVGGILERFNLLGLQTLREVTLCCSQEQIEPQQQLLPGLRNVSRSRGGEVIAFHLKVASSGLVQFFNHVPNDLCADHFEYTCCLKTIHMIIEFVGPHAQIGSYLFDRPGFRTKGFKDL